jgi:hypothetical protein
MVATVDLARVAVHQALFHQRSQQRILFEPDFVRQLVRLMGRHLLFVLERAGDLCGDVLHEGSAGGDVQHLHAAADRENRQLPPARFAKGTGIAVSAGSRVVAVRAAARPTAMVATDTPKKENEMPYIEGFVAAVPNDKKAEYLKHARQSVAYFKKLGATRCVECWGNDVPKGVLTDFYKATQAKDPMAILAAGETLNASCDNCHRQYQRE